MRILLCASLVVLLGACVLEDKQVGGAELEDAPPDPCEVYCERVSDYLAEDQPPCVADCQDATLDTACRDAVLAVLTCLDVTACDNFDQPSHPCYDLVLARDESCDGL